jgi:hypothetical protein
VERRFQRLLDDKPAILFLFVCCVMAMTLLTIAMRTGTAVASAMLACQLSIDMMDDGTRGTGEDEVNNDIL